MAFASRENRGEIISEGSQNRAFLYAVSEASKCVDLSEFVWGDIIRDFVNLSY